MKVLVISCSLNPDSRSAELARTLMEDLRAFEPNTEWLDVAALNLPLCDGASVYGDPKVRSLGDRIRSADAIAVAAPVYNYDLNAAAKNLLELTGQAWTGKVVGFLIAAGGAGSYMSVMPFANSLMLDYRCVIVPRFVYATGQAFVDGRLPEDSEIRRRVRSLAKDLHAFGSALHGLTEKAK